MECRRGTRRDPTGDPELTSLREDTHPRDSWNPVMSPSDNPRHLSFSVADALKDALALIQFDAAGRVLDANSNFLALCGQDLDVLKGRHFTEILDTSGLGRAAFSFDQALHGHCRSADMRLACSARPYRWMHVVCAPLAPPAAGLVVTVTDITSAKDRSIEAEGRIAALDRSQAIVEFDLGGIILRANQRFCSTFGYQPAELEGRHHSILVDPLYQSSPAYAEFWHTLRRGEYLRGEFQRIAKDGQPVWIQASYNPILDLAGLPHKIVKFATDTTAAKVLALENEAKITALDRSQAIIEFAVDGTILDANANFLAMTGYTLDEIRGSHHSIFVPPGECDAASYQTFWENLRKGRFQAAEYQRLGRNGQTIWIQATYNPVFDLTGRTAKIVKFATDVTERVRQRKQMQLLSLVADQTSSSVVITDLEGRIEFVNAGFTRMNGYCFAEVRGRRPGDVLQGPLTDQATRRKISEQLSRRQPVQEEIVNYNKSKEPYWASLFINPVTDENGTLIRFVSVQTDVTQRRKLEEQAVFLARHDALTKLGNRMLFQERLQEGLRNRTASALIYLDLDRFKQVNDTLGHPAGDILLQQVAGRLLACVRETDTVVRLGGDEFAIICNHDDRNADVRVMAQRIIARVSQPYLIGVVEAVVGVTAGIAFATDPALSPEQLVDQADRALYAAKQAGRGRFEIYAAEVAE